MAGIGGAIAGIGFRAIAGHMAGRAVSGLSAAGKWVGGLDLIHALCVMLAIFGAWQTVGRWVQHRHTVKVEGQLSDSTVQLTAARASVATSQANEAKLRAVVADQNVAIAVLGKKSAAQQQEAAGAVQAANARAAEAVAVATRLRASASQHAPRKPSAPCVSDPEVSSQWK